MHLNSPWKSTKIPTCSDAAGLDVPEMLVNPRQFRDELPLIPTAQTDTSVSQQLSTPVCDALGLVNLTASLLQSYPPKGLDCSRGTLRHDNCQ